MAEIPPRLWRIFRLGYGGNTAYVIIERHHKSVITRASIDFDFGGKSIGRGGIRI